MNFCLNVKVCCKLILAQNMYDSWIAALNIGILYVHHVTVIPMTPVIRHKANGGLRNRASDTKTQAFYRRKGMSGIAYACYVLRNDL